MEHLEGQTLAERLAKGPLPVQAKLLDFGLAKLRLSTTTPSFAATALAAAASRLVCRDRLGNTIPLRFNAGGYIRSRQATSSRR